MNFENEVVLTKIPPPYKFGLWGPFLSKQGVRINEGLLYQLPRIQTALNTGLCYVVHVFSKKMSGLEIWSGERFFGNILTISKNLSEQIFINTSRCAGFRFAAYERLTCVIKFSSIQ